MVLLVEGAETSLELKASNGEILPKAIINSSMISHTFISFVHLEKFSLLVFTLCGTVSPQSVVCLFVKKEIGDDSLL